MVRGLKFTTNAGITRSYSAVYFSVKVGFNVCVGWMKSLYLTIRLEALRKNNGYATNGNCCSTPLLVTNANQTSFVQSYLLITLNPSAKGWVNCCVLQRGLLIQLRAILLNCSLWTASAQYGHLSIRDSSFGPTDTKLHVFPTSI